MSQSAEEPAASEVQGPEQHAFQAEVNQVLDIVIHSLYSHREIFLRELVSNASDALDQLRFRAVTEHDLMGDDGELEIRLIPDREGGTLIISDNGVGMTRQEMIENLGTIARSGSRRFLEALKEKGDGGEGVDFIGRFGVGFYSSFLVAENVEVSSRAAGAEEAWTWRSDAQGTFEIEPAPDKKTRGTVIKLGLREDQKEYLDEWRLRELVRRYSDFVGHPIRLRVEKKEEGEEEPSYEFETINKASALWRRPKSEISDEDYEEFYKHLTRDWEAPLARSHFSIEGSHVFTGLLFIPKNAPFDLGDRSARRGVRLYVKRVFIMDECEDLLPEWLRFVRGIIDSDDLPLNVSRELLQEDRAVRMIRKNIVSKTLTCLEKLAADDPDAYRAFWDVFGPVMKEGLHFDPEQKERLAELVRYTSTAEECTSLADYVGRMPEDQKEIYYVTGASRKAVEGSPHMEAVTKRGYEVLFMTDPIDEWAMEGLQEYGEKKLVSVMRANLELEASEEEKQKIEERKVELEGLMDRIGSILEDDVSEVRASSRLTDSPCCLVVPEGGMHAHIERMLRAQNQDMPATKRVLEVNPDHPVIQRLEALAADEANEGEVKEWVHTLHDQALLSEGSPIGDPQGFARRMSRLMTKALGS